MKNGSILMGTKVVASLIGKANKLKRLGELEEAVEVYLQIVEVNPSFAWGYYYLGEALFSLERWDEAIAYLEKAVNLNSDSAWFHFLLGKIWASKESLDKAVACFQKAIEFQANTPIFYEVLGEVLVKQEKLDEAVRWLNKSPKLTSKVSMAYQRLGCLQKKEGKLPNAIDNFRKAIELNPHSAFLYQSLGDALTEKKAYVEAITCFRKATEIEPQFALAFHHLGDVLQHQGAIDDAINAYRRAIKLKPDYLPSYLHLANALWKNLQDSEAENCYQKALELSPSSHLIHCDLGYALTRQGKFKEAIHHYQAASRLMIAVAKPDYVQNYWDSGKVKGPDFAILGAQKCGTTSLYEYIAQHPHFLPSIRKEIDFFSVRYDKGIDWYLAHFPPTPDDTSYFTGEASTSNLDYPQVAERFYQHFPDLKFIALLRNPVDRAFSHYNHILRFHPGEETRTFEEAVDEEIDFINQLDEPRILEVVAKRAHRGYLLRGLYFYYIQHWMTVFPRERFLILESEDFYANPRETMGQVFEFLEVLPHHSDRYAKYNSGSYSSGISKEMRSKLSDFFCTYNSKLEELLGFEFNFVKQQVKVDMSNIKNSKANNCESTQLGIIESQKLNQADLYYKKGEKLKNEGKDSEAIKEYTKAIECFPDHVSSLHELAAFYEKQQKFEQAIGYYRHLVKLQPNCSFFLSHLAWNLLQIGNASEAITFYQKAIDTEEEQPAYVHINMGNAFEENGRFDEAISQYEQAINVEPNSPYGYKRLADVLNQLQKAEAAIIACKKAIELQPGNCFFYLTLSTSYAMQNNEQEVVNCLKKAIHLKQDLPYGLYKRLASILRQQGKEDEASGILLSSPYMEDGKIFYQEIWQDLNKLDWKDLEQHSHLYPENIKIDVACDYFQLNSKYRIIDLEHLTEDDKKYIEDSDLSLAYLELNRAMLTANEVTSAQRPRSQITAARHRDFYAKAFATVEQSTSFQKFILDKGCFYVICPSTGKLLSSNRSVPFNSGFNLYVPLYRFVGNEVFYLITSRIWSEIQALYFPEKELIISLTEFGFTPLLPTPQVINTYKADAVVNWQKIKPYILNNKLPEKAAIIGFCENLGHHLWNELSALDKLYKSGHLNKVDKFLVIGSEFFGRIDEIFPEIPATKIQRISRQEISKIILDNNYFAFRLGHLVITQELVDRIYQASLKKCSASFLSELENAKQHFPLIWINVRSRNRRNWVSQIEGLANIIQLLSESYPNLGVVFDGYSRVDRSYRKWNNSEEEAYIDGEKSMVKEILGLIPNNTVTVYDTIGSMMHESIAWAYKVDVCLIPQGTGVNKPIMLANKPGVIFGNRDYYEVYESVFRSQRENLCEPVWVVGDTVVDDESNGISNYDVSVAYDCDWKVMYDELIKIIGRLEKN